MFKGTVQNIYKVLAKSYLETSFLIKVQLKMTKINNRYKYF